MFGLMTTRTHKRLMRDMYCEYNERITSLALSQDMTIQEIRSWDQMYRAKHAENVRRQMGTVLRARK